MHIIIEKMVTLVIQAGGESRRMGADKAQMPFLGEALVQRVLRRLKPLAAEVWVTSNSTEALVVTGAQLVPDQYPNLGPLGGLLTGLLAARQPLVALVACDMPFASLALFQTALALMQSRGCDVVVPRSPDGLEPLHALYRVSTCLPAVQKAVASGNLRMVGWYAEVQVLEMSLDEVEQIDPGFHAFINLNTPEEFARAEALARKIAYHSM